MEVQLEVVQAAVVELVRIVDRTLPVLDLDIVDDAARKLVRLLVQLAKCPIDPIDPNSSLGVSVPVAVFVVLLSLLANAGVQEAR